MKTKLAFFLVGLIFASVAYSITVNPASSVTADSAATALTIPYRDSNGDFAVNSLTLNSALKPFQHTVAELQVLVPAVGDTYYCSDCSPKKIVIATGTSAGNFADAVGSTFK